MAKAKRKAKKKATKKKFTGCKNVTVCGNRRKICWRAGRIVSNKPATRAKPKKRR